MTRLRWIHDAADQSWSLFAAIDGRWVRLTAGYYCHGKPSDADARHVARRLERFYPSLMREKAVA